MNEIRIVCIKKLVHIILTHGKYEFDNGCDTRLQDSVFGTMHVCISAVHRILLYLYEEKDFDEMAYRFMQTLIDANNSLREKNE